MIRRSLLGGVLALAGCSVMPAAPYIEKRDWPLTATRPTTRPPTPSGPVLLVRSLRAAPGLDSRRLRVLGADGSTSVNFYEQWSAPPPLLVEDALRRWLADSGVFAAVLAPGSRLSPDLVLEGELTALWFDQRRGMVRVAIAGLLLAPAAPRDRVLLQESFAAESKPASPDTVAIVAATRVALAHVCAAIENAVAAAAKMKGADASTHQPG